jgi:hypothetical protein
MGKRTFHSSRGEDCSGRSLHGSRVSSDRGCGLSQETGGWISAGDGRPTTMTVSSDGKGWQGNEVAVEEVRAVGVSESH